MAGREETKSNVPTTRTKPMVSMKPGYMIKVLPKTPPLLFREGEPDIMNENTHSNHSESASVGAKEPQGSYGTSPSDIAENEYPTRTNRTSSVSSVSSISFPPLPPPSLLNAVDEDYNNYHNSQTILQF